jgi:hypothetical protein
VNAGPSSRNGAVMRRNVEIFRTAGTLKFHADESDHNLAEIRRRTFPPAIVEHHVAAESPMIISRQLIIVRKNFGAFTYSPKPFMTRVVSSKTKSLLKNKPAIYADEENHCA